MTSIFLPFAASNASVIPSVVSWSVSAKAESPFFTYVEDGAKHEVWFEDVRSLQGKFRLINEYGLRGCGYWQIMQWFRANWLLLANQFYIV